MKQPRTHLQDTLNLLKMYTSNDTYSIYKTPGGWYHVTDDQFGFLVSAPTQVSLIIAMEAYIDGYTNGLLTAEKLLAKNA